MDQKVSPTELLALSFLQKARDLSADVEPIKILKARAYKILNSNVLVRSSVAGSNGRYFFGLNYIHAEEIANFDNAYFVFICGNVERILILPSSILIENLPFISHDRNGEYKIIIDASLHLVLKGRGNRLDCSDYINAWHLLSDPPRLSRKISSAEESLHSVLQGRLLEIGNIRGFQTFCPNKAKKFNGKQLSEIASLPNCPQLQFSEYNLLRQIDVLWFREKGQHYIPECAFEVELSTGTWSGVGRMATLIDYANTRLYVISNENRKFQQVMGAFYELQSRYNHIETQLISELYSAEINLRDLRFTIGL